jgi:hypothetical protein
MATTSSFKESRVLRAITVTLTYADATSAEMFQLPKNARIVDWVVNVRTAFSGGTTTLDVGTASDPDYFIDGISLASVGKTALSTALKKPGEKLSDITAVYANVGASNTAGEVRLTCLVALEQETPVR